MNTRILFLDELNQVRHDLLSMASRVEEDLGKAMDALRNSDTDLAEEVKADDAAVNALQIKIDDQAATLIATQQPVARDLRELVAVFKISGSLERAGDYAVHLAKTAVRLSGEPPFRAREHLEQMAETGREMIRRSLSAYLNRDPEAARETAALDDRIDAEHKALSAEILSLMEKHPELIGRAVRLLKTSGFLERLGDHITNICEAVIYMVESKHEELN
jgi:phosphate transport system protein